MIAYNETVKTFINDVNTNCIAQKVLNTLNINVNQSQYNAWVHSLPEMAKILQLAKIPGDVRVGIEYKIPLTNRRVDFLVTGMDDKKQENIVVIELKQWEKVQHTDMEDIVLLGNEEHVHPSWQAYSYTSTIENFNEYVDKNNVKLEPCAFLHNYKRSEEGELRNSIYKEGINAAYPFISDEYQKLADFIKKYIKVKANRDLLFEIENGRIKPSKMLVNSLASMLNGNKEYDLLDEQKIVFENLKHEIVKNQHKHEKNVYIVTGGAGTGKSLIAIQLMGAFCQQKGYTAFYVAKSSYVKESYFKKLTNNVPNYSFLRTLFKGSGDFIDAKNNEFDILIVDEAHRLTERTKMSYFYKGANQIQEIIHAAKTSIFFIDETQNIDIKDYGTIQHIMECAELEKATVHYDASLNSDGVKNPKYNLRSQFRCNGSDEYIAWLESVLYNLPFVPSGQPVDYDIKIFDDINELKNEIVTKNNNSTTSMNSRMLSGDVFPWVSRSNKSAIDITIGSFQAQWNKTRSFAVDPKSIDQVGCVHTAQGMEFEYVGLIIGDDLRYENNKVITDYTKHPAKAGEFKRPYQHKPMSSDADLIDQIIRNTYKVLFTRGQKGTYLYIMDSALKTYLQGKIDELKRS